jgi:hypothetical protein
MSGTDRGAAAGAGGSRRGSPAGAAGPTGGSPHGARGSRARQPIQPTLRRMRRFGVRPDRELGQNFLID